MSLTGSVVPSAPPSAIAFTGCEMLSAAAGLSPRRSPTACPSAPPRGRGQRQAGQDHRRARPLLRARGDGAHQASAGGAGPADGRHQHAHRRDGRAGHRRRGAQHQSVLVQGRAGRGGRAHQEPERGWRSSARPTRIASPRSRRSRCSFRSSPRSSSRTRSRSSGLRGAAVGASVRARISRIRSSSRSGASARTSTSSSSSIRRARPSCRAPRRQRLARRTRSAIRWTRRSPVAADLRRHARQIPRAEDLLGARRRLSAFLRRPLRRGDPLLPHRVGTLPRRTDRVPQGGQLYFDTLVFTPEALRHLVAETGPARS